MKPIISLIAALASGSVADLPTLDAAPVRSASFSPQITCQINMQSWCITNSIEVIGMSYEDGIRIWRLNDRLYFNDGPLIIVEDKANCSRGNEVIANKNYEKISGGKYIISYSLTKEIGCNLEFRIPINNGNIDPAYKQAILYQIMIDGKQIYHYETGAPALGVKTPK